MHEIVEDIASTRMPDGDYPKFKLFETENIIQVQFSWGELEVTVVKSFLFWRQSRSLHLRWIKNCL